MEFVVLALGAGAVLSMWRHRVTHHTLGPADPYMNWMLDFTDRQAYRSF